MAELHRLDMHVHTHASWDSLSRPERVIAAARERGIDRVVIADHNQIHGALEAHALDPERMLVGEEIRTAEGPEIIGILLRERIPKGTPARETCERIRAQGGVVYVPHPFDTRRSGGGPLLEELADCIDVVEAHNARSWGRGVNARGERWATERGFALGAGSDAHTPGEIGRGYVELPPFKPTREGLLAALAAGRVAGRTLSSPLCAAFSTYAKLHKKVIGPRLVKPSS
ncbi:MAG: PHP domain-containing protein [Gemmatimonadota bacterium]|jgi:predicted metal-dependent phosphoesterase TrpH|nr:PHP domain-containing protein [Gemmatimonadota bacterium]